MKKNLTITTVIIAIFATSASLYAGPFGKKGNKHRKVDKEAENAAVREEALLVKKDDHGWQKDPLATDKRSERIGDYSKHTYGRIIRLLTIGALEEKDGRVFKARHEGIVKTAKAARDADGEFSQDESLAMRNALNLLNDDINAAIKEPEKGDDRTPLVNHAQHRFEERIEAGIKTGRLSTLEASSLRRKLDRLAAAEERLKSGNGLSSRERERLMEEVVEVRRDLFKALKKN